MGMRYPLCFGAYPRRKKLCTDIRQALGVVCRKKPDECGLKLNNIKPFKSSHFYLFGRKSH